MLSVLPSVVVLGLVAIVAVRIAQSRSSPVEAAIERIAASAVLGIATAIQSAHFVEEWVTGFSRPIPSIAGPGPYAAVVFCYLQSGLDSYLDRINTVTPSRSKSSILRRLVPGHRWNTEWCCPSDVGNCVRWLLSGADNIALYWASWCDSLATAPIGHSGVSSGYVTGRFWPKATKQTPENSPI